MRLFLDAHVTGRVIARALRERSHDVRAANEEFQIDGWEDEPPLEFAATEQRIMITFNVKDFPRIVRDWAAGRHHDECLILVGIDHGEFGLVLRVVDAALTARPDPSSWRDYAAWGTRRTGW